MTLRGRVADVQSAQGYLDGLQRVTIKPVDRKEYWQLMHVRNVDGLALDDLVEVTVSVVRPERERSENKVAEGLDKG